MYRSVYRWHSVVDARLGAATGAVVVSKDAWNEWARSPIVVPLDASLRANALRPSLGEIGVADCTRPITVSQNRLSTVRGRLSAEESTAVTAALVSMLNVAHLINGTVPPQPARPPAGWYPRFGSIYVDTLPVGGQEKMFAIVSDDRWNATQRFVIGLRLTSKRKELRQGWEVPLTGGPAIVGDIHLIPTARLEQTPPRPPRPAHCTPGQRAAIGRGLQLVLNL